MGFEDAEIVFDHDDKVYYPGQMLRGKLEFELDRVEKFRGIYAEIVGGCMVSWTSTQSRKVNDRKEYYTAKHEGYEEYINVTIYLVGSKSGEHSLRPGRHRFPFECKLPADCPATFETQVAFLSYNVRITVERKFEQDHTILAGFTVNTDVDLNKNPYCKEPIVFHFDQMFCCCCMSSGAAETTVRLPAGGFVPKQLIPIQVECNNSSRVKIKFIRFFLKRSVRFEATREPSTACSNTDLAVMKKGPVPPNTTRNWTLEMEVPDLEVKNVDTCKFISIDYKFQVIIETSGCHKDQEESRRIFIGSIPVGSKPPKASNTDSESVQYTESVTSSPAPPTNFNQSLPNYPNGAPYPASYQGENAPCQTVDQTYPGVNMPYPGVNPPYPGANSPNPGANPPYSVANLHHPVNTQNIAHTGPEHSYLTVSPYSSPTSNPAFPNPPQNPPYATSQHVNTSAPYPTSYSPYSTHPPYNPDMGAQQFSPGQNRINPPYTSPHLESNHPYPPQNPGANFPSPHSPYPPSNSAYTPGKSAVAGLKSGTIGFIGVHEPAETRPLLPPAVLPMPYTSASAPSMP